MASPHTTLVKILTELLSVLTLWKVLSFLFLSPLCFIFKRLHGVHSCFEGGCVKLNYVYFVREVEEEREWDGGERKGKRLH